MDTYSLMVRAVYNEWSHWFLRLFLVGNLIAGTMFNTAMGQSVAGGYINYTVNDGLPSSEVHDICEGSNGLIWIATDRGVCSFDGYHFRIYGPEDGMYEQTVWRILRDSFERLWFIGLSGRLHYFEKDRFFVFGGNSLLDTHHSGNVLTFNHRMSPETFYFRYNGAQPGYKIDLRHLTLSAYYTDASDDVFHRDGEKLVLEVKTPPTKLEISHETDLGLLKNRIGLLPYILKEHSDGRIFISLLKDVLQILPGVGRIERLFKGEGMVGTEFHPDGTIHIYHGRFINSLQNNQIDTFCALPEGVEVSGCYHDREGGHWITTLDQGVFYLTGSRIRQIRRWEIKDKVRALFSWKDKLFVGTKKDGLYVMNNLGTTRRFDCFKLIDHIAEKGDGVLVSSNRVGVCEANYMGTSISTFGTGLRYYEPYYWQLKSSSVLYSPNLDVWHRITQFDGFRVYAMLPFDSGWYFGTSKGLFFKKEDTITFLGDRFSELATRVSDIILLDSNFWISTIGRGILMYDGDSVYSIQKGNTILPSNYCNDLYADDEKNVWVCTNGGLARVTPAPTLGGHHRLDVYTIQDGLSNNEVVSCTGHNGQLYVGTKDGLDKVSFATKDETRSVDYGLAINHLSSRGSQLPLIGEHRLAYDQNDIEIGFKGLCYRCLGQLEYQYRIPGLSDLWTSTTQTKVDLFDLPVGDYQFELKCIGYKMPPSDVVRFNFSILAPFYAQRWFKALVSLTLLVLIFLVARYAFKRRQLLVLLKSYQYSTFTAQLNPHFIFNSLNGIQNLFLKKEIADGVKYMSIFGRLLRGLLQNPESSLISLSDEQAQLETYVELENLRFRGKLVYQFSVGTDYSKEEIWVPPMLIQPLVENSIHHGIFPKGEGRIDVMITQSGKSLLVCVKDNGIGYEASRRKKQQKEKGSFGLRLTKKRVEVINQVNRGEQFFQIIDETERGGEGTTICFKIPLIVKPITHDNDRIN